MITESLFCTLACLETTYLKKGSQNNIYFSYVTLQSTQLIKTL